MGWQILTSSIVVYSTHHMEENFSQFPLGPSTGYGAMGQWSH
jgi:hypothetical protein